jgi:TM2 domain-containing membrane protein YozV
LYEKNSHSRLIKFTKANLIFLGTKLFFVRIDKLEVVFIMREPFIAGILSFLIPGLGQIYNGRVLIGILWIILTGFSWIGSAGTLGWVVHIIAAWCAFSFAKDNPVR